MEEQFDCIRNSIYNNLYVIDGNNIEIIKKVLNNLIYKKKIMYKLFGLSLVFCLFDVYNIFFYFYFIMSIYIILVINI